MKKKIGDLISKPTKENVKIIKRALKKEIKILDYLGKFPPRYYAYKMMVKYLRELVLWNQIFNEELLSQEIEVKDND